MNDEEIVQAYGEGISILIKGDGKNNEKIKNCQSCGMLLKTEEYFGTEKDGSPSEDFCKYCYNKGEFFEMTMEDMINFCAPTVAEHDSIDVEEAKKLMGEFFPSLKRWKK
jgi:hypothetical protein